MLLRHQFAAQNPLSKVLLVFSWDPSLTASGWRSILFGFHYCSLSFVSSQRGFDEVVGGKEGRSLSPETWLLACVSWHPQVTEGAQLVISLICDCGVLLKINLFSCFYISVICSIRFLWCFIVLLFVLLYIKSPYGEKLKRL